MLVALGTIASEQAEGTHQTREAAVWFLNYAATHPDAVVRFRASEMQLHEHSDASYHSESKARSRAAGFYFLDGKDDPRPDAPTPPLNGPVHILCEILKNVMSSAAEAETDKKATPSETH